MTDFLDINPVPPTVQIDGKKVTVPGISMEGFGYLIPKFPRLVSDLQERLQKEGAISVLTIIEVAGPAIGAILAAGFGHPGNEEAEAKASKLDAMQQMEILDKILERTMPAGLGPFVEQWAKLMERFSTPEQKLQKLRSKILQKQSKPSSDGAMPLAMSG